MGCFFIIDQTVFIAGESSRMAQTSAATRRYREGRNGKIMDSKIIFLGIARRAWRGVFERGGVWEWFCVFRD